MLQEAGAVTWEHHCLFCPVLAVVTQYSVKIKFYALDLGPNKVVADVKKCVIEELWKSGSQGEYLHGGEGYTGKHEVGHHLEIVQ